MNPSPHVGDRRDQFQRPSEKFSTGRRPDKPDDKHTANILYVWTDSYFAALSFCISCFNRSASGSWGAIASAFSNAFAASLLS